MKRYGRILALIVAMAITAAACGADDAQEGAAILVDGGATIVVANSPGTLTTNGPQRVLVALLGEGPNSFLGGADQPAIVEISSVEGSTSSEVMGEWLSTSGVALGLYVATYTFDEPGLWSIGIKSNEDVSAALIEVGSESTVPEVGEPAPPSLTPTAESLDEIATISTDPDPELRFYSLSVADAVTNGRPTVVVFATPAFCRTAICGPTVELAKEVAADHLDVDFVHVEPFAIEAARAGTLNPIEAMFDWNLATEPWVFVIDADGLIAASFEGIIGTAEMEAALDAL